MPFQPINFANITPQGNPFLRDFVQTLTEGMKAGRLPQALEQQAKERELQNSISGINAKYAEPQAQAGLAHTQAQTSNLQADAGLNPFRRALLEAQGRSAGATADKSQMIQKFMQQIMNGGQAGGQAGGQMGGEMGSATDQTSGQGGAPSYAQADLMSKLMGLNAPKIVDIGGQKMAVSSFGVAPVVPNEGFATNTPAIRSLNANIVNGVENALPLIDELSQMDVPTQTLGRLASPNLQAAYQAKTGQAVDTIAAAMGLPKTSESLNLVKDFVQRKPWESLKAYRDRLGDLKKDLMKRRSSAKGVLKTGTSTRPGSQYSDEDIAHTAQKYNMTREQVLAKLGGQNG